MADDREREGTGKRRRGSPALTARRDPGPRGGAPAGVGLPASGAPPSARRRLSRSLPRARQGGGGPLPRSRRLPRPAAPPSRPPPPRPSSEAEPRFLRGLGPRLLRRRPGHNGVLVHGLRDAASRPSARLSWPQAPRRQPLRPWAPGAAWVRTDPAARVRGAPPRPRRNPARSAWRSRPPFCLHSGDVGGRPRGHRRSVAQASKCWCAPRVVACLKQTS